MMGHSGNRRRFVATLASIPVAWAGTHEVAPAAAATDYSATPTVPADQGLQRLIDGNQRFVTGNLTSLRIRANIAMGVEQLQTAEPVLAEAVGRGRLTVAGGYYDLASGAVSLLA